MNNYQRDLNCIKASFKADWEEKPIIHIYAVATKKACDDLQELVNKEKPMKPLEPETHPLAMGMANFGYIKYTCPHCHKKEQAFYSGDDIQSYCSDCGQRLDWGKEK
jgi:hypothetical protein